MACAEAVTLFPIGGVPVAVAVLVKLEVTLLSVHEYPASLAPGANVPEKDFTQLGAIGSATVTLVSATLPVLVTTMVHVAVPPDVTVWLAGNLVMPMLGFST